VYTPTQPDTPPFGEVKRKLEGALLVKLTIPQTRQTQVPSGISYTGFNYYYAAWCPERGWLSKSQWDCTALVGGSTIKAAVADYTWRRLGALRTSPV
jgi:hypothetical protein